MWAKNNNGSLLHGRVIRLSPVARYGIAIAAAGAATLLSLELDSWSPKPPFLLFFPAIIVSAWLGGLGPGIVATVLCAMAAAFFWMTQFHSLLSGDLADFAGLVVFVGVGYVISVLTETWRQAASSIVQSEEHLKAMFASIGDAVIATDESGRVKRLNTAAESMTGWTEAEAKGRPLEDVFVGIDGKTRLPSENPVHPVLQEGVIKSGPANYTVLFSRDGREISVDASASPIKTAGGRVAGAILVFRDITQRLGLERERTSLLAETERMAEELRHLQALTDTALANLEPDTLIQKLLARIRTALASDTAMLLLVDAGGRHLTPVACDGFPDVMLKDIHIPVAEGVVGRIARSEGALIIDDLSDAEIGPILPKNVKSLVGAPLKIGGRLLGVMHAGTSTPRRFTDADVRLLSLAAGRVALAIRRARLHEAERAARHAAETAEQQLRLALESGRMGTWQWIIGSGEVKWSPGLEAIHGFAPGTFPGTFDAVREEIHPDDRDRVLQSIAKAVESGEDFYVEYRIIRPDGAVRWVEGRGRIFRDSEKRPGRMVGICADITERKQAEEKFRLTVEAAPTAMVLVDHRGIMLFVNSLMEQLAGYTRDELVGESVDRLIPLRFRRQHTDYLAGFFKEAGPRSIGAGRELYVLRKDGTEVPIEIGLSPIETADGTFVIATVTDITERKRVAEAEQQAKRKAEEANRAKDEFLAMLSHELRTPLSSILGWAVILRSGRLPFEQASHALEVIERNARIETQLVDSLLDLSRITAGKLKLNMDRVDLSSVVRAVVDSLRPGADAKGITIDLTVPPGPVTIRGDGGRLQQIFSNLVSNALKFTSRNGHVQIHLTRMDSQVEIQVIDDGEGIHAEFLPLIFDRFLQAESTKERAYGGLGLGLAIVRELVHAHGGTVAGQSPGKGRGSTFTVTLPVLGVVPSSTEVTTPQLEHEELSISKLRVLAVDDDNDARELVALILQSRGALTRTASSAAEALDSISRERPDVLLADIGMPQEDGYTLIQKLRAIERENQQSPLPAIALTAYASPIDREQALMAGYDLHLTKPVDPLVLARAVARVSRKS
jgi:PAS domain S-box-containing protein